MIMLVIFCLLSCADSSTDGSGPSWTSSRPAHDRSSGTFGNFSLYIPLVNDYQEVHNELNTARPLRVTTENEENDLQRISLKKSTYETLNMELSFPRLGRLPHKKYTEDFFGVDKTLRKIHRSPIILNQKSYPRSINTAPVQDFSRQKRSALLCLSPQIPLRSSGETAKVNARSTDLYVFTPVLPVTIRAQAVFCCFWGSHFSIELSVSSTEINMNVANQWHQLKVEVTYSQNSWNRHAYTLQIANLLGRGTREKQETWTFAYNFISLYVSVTGSEVKWYAGKKKHDCSKYRTTTTPPTSSPPTTSPPTTTPPTTSPQAPAAITTLGVTPVPEENATRVVAAVETASDETNITMAEPIGGSDASSFNLQWLWLLLLLGLTAIIIAVVMVCKKKTKASLRSGAPSAFRRESVNSLYGVTPETRKTSVNSLYGTDMGTSEPICSGPNPIYANDARQNAAGQGVSGGRNDAVETNTRSWVDPKEVNAYYSVDSANYEPMSPDARGYYNKC